MPNKDNKGKRKLPSNLFDDVANERKLNAKKLPITKMGITTNKNARYSEISLDMLTMNATYN